MLSVRRVMGAETEFGISQPGRPHANPMRDSARVIDAYAGPRGLKSSQSFWDFDTESPLADARGFIMNEAQAHISQLTHLPQAQPDAQYLANVVLENGARYYVDHAHPEYSSPETLTPRDVVLWDRAGDVVALRSVEALAGGEEPVNLYKNNTDSKGASYGAHENYLVDRDVDFDELAACLIPFFTTRQVLCGAGRVGIGAAGEEPGYQISSRADFFEAEVGLETTLRRPIVNTRDEPHTDPLLYRRLHVIIGDATMAEPATLVRFGSTSLVLGLIEAGRCPRIELADPVAALQQVSHDLSLSVPLELADGSHMTAIEIQRMYWQAAAEAVGESADADTAEVVEMWDRFLTDLAEDPMRLAAEIDWVAKLQLLTRYQERESLPWNHPKLALIDVQYHDVRPSKGLFYKLEAAGRIRRYTTDEQVAHAVENPPEDTRAYLRGRVVEKFTDSLISASWDSLVFTTGGERLVRVPMKYPLKGTKELVGEIVESAGSVGELLKSLGITTLEDSSPRGPRDRNEV